MRALNDRLMRVGTCAILPLLFGAAAQAADPAWTLSGPSNSNTPGTGVLGTEFVVNQNITVTDLGWYDNPLTSVGRNRPANPIFNLRSV